MPICSGRDRKANRERQAARNSETRRPRARLPLLNQRRFRIFDRNQTRTAIGPVNKQGDAGANPRRLCINGRDWLNMRAHDDLSDATTLGSTRHNVFELAYPRSPDMSVAAAKFFKSAAHCYVRPEAIQNPAFFFVDNLRLHGLVGLGSRENELPRHQMSP